MITTDAEMHDKLDLFLAVSRSLSKSQTVDELCRSVACGLVQAGLDRCSVVLGIEYAPHTPGHGPAGDEPTVGQEVAVADRLMDDVNPDMREIQAGVRISIADYPTIQRTVRDREPVHIAHVQGDERLAEHERQWLSKWDIRSAAICPLVSRDRAMGYVLAGMRSGGGIAEDDLGLYQAIVDRAAAAIEVITMVKAMEQLQYAQDRLSHEIMDAHERLIGELSAPLIPITQSILVLPLVGAIDSVRAQRIMESLLEGVETHDAQVVIMDITGVPVLDTGVANHLIQMTNAANLLGAKTVLVGIVPRVAQTLVELGVDLSIITTRNNLQGGVEYALRTQGLHIVPIANWTSAMHLP